ncbi:MAG: hypothetical protein ABI193_02660 [Minicystis sp.]
MRRRGIEGVGAALIAGVLLLGAACTGADQSSAPCVTVGDCDDGDPCTADACLRGGCVQNRVADGPGDFTQFAGDCHQIICKDGAVVLDEDPADIADDDDECTTDSCINGVSAHMPAGDGIVCHLPNSAGICLAGLCEAPICGPQIPCNDENPCTADGCNAEGTACLTVPLTDIPTPLTQQTPGDCRENRCVNGDSKDVADDADVPDDGNPCTMDACDKGKPKHPFAPAGTPCGEGLFCDAAGHCGS